MFEGKDMNFFQLIIDCFPTYSVAFWMTIKLAIISLMSFQLLESYLDYLKSVIIRFYE